MRTSSSDGRIPSLNWKAETKTNSPLQQKLKAKIKAISSNTHQFYTTAPLYNIIIIFDTVVRQKQHFKYKNNEFNSAAIFRFGMHHQGLAAARPTCPAYVDGRKRENSYCWMTILWLHPRADIPCSLVVTYRVWMKNCVSTMTKMLHIFCISSPSFAVVHKHRLRDAIRHISHTLSLIGRILNPSGQCQHLVTLRI